MAITHVSEQDFEERVLRSELPVLVDFHADWCQPCKLTEPEVDALAQELEGKLEVAKVDIDKNQRLAGMLRIQSVPTFMVFAGGRPVAAEQGAVRRERLRELVDPFLPRAEGAIRAPELAAMIQQGQVVAIDTRDAGSYARAHIPGAKHIALEEVNSRLAELHMYGTPVVYCRSGDKTKELSEQLTKDGIGVAFLESGFLAWEAEMLPIERD
jgi:thioredoxin 1/putative thioredoxin